jgi:hypothetical protein
MVGAGLSADEETLLEEARDCDDCVPWLKHCKAECCREFTFTLTSKGELDRSQPELRVRTQMSADLRRYLELRGAKVEGSTIVVPMDRCTVSGGLVHVAMPCTALRSDYLCSLHPDGKPDVCRDLTLETARSGDYWIAPSCLFAYKMRIPSPSDEDDT